jgi:hypothetical protein
LLESERAGVQCQRRFQILDDDGHVIDLHATISFAR